MTIISPGVVRYILKTCLLSRVFLFVLQVIANSLIPDHNADAHRNKQTYAVNNALVHQNLTNDYIYSYKAIEGLTKWDGQYFLEISNDGYTSESHLAFLPLYPLIISTVRKCFFKDVPGDSSNLFSSQGGLGMSSSAGVPTSSLESYIISAVLGVALNNLVFFPVACLTLCSLTKLVKKGDDNYAKDVVWWFCYNPASVFFSACYTESLFAALTFSAMMMIEHRYQTYIQKHELSGTDQKGHIYEPLAQLDRMVFVSLPSLALISLSTATRSNGMATIGFIMYQFLLKYASLKHLDRSGWSILSHLSMSLEIVQDLIIVFMGSVIAAAGYISFQIWSYLKFCTPNAVKGKLNMRLDWCDALIPHPYGYVQAKYWNVGPFRYYQAKQLPNFLLALPISALVLTASLRKSKQLGRTTQGKRQLAYYLHAIVLTIFCGVSINVQVITRLLAASCPVLYWICADIRMQSRKANYLLKTYFLSYFVVGTILHTNYYPWT